MSEPERGGEGEAPLAHAATLPDSGERAAREEVAFAETMQSDAGRVAYAETVQSDAGQVAVGSIDDASVTDEHRGRYAPGRELGRGGIGRVFVAMDEHLGREVAVKQLLLEPAEGSGPSRQALARFLREARVTGQLEHPGIVPVHELGRRPDGSLYYTMKLVRGRSLGRALGEAEDLDARLRLLGHFRDLCEALAYAHSRGVVHRDLKPDNVMVGAFGETVLVDWGLAKVRGARDLRGEELGPRAEGESGERLRMAGEGETLEGAALGTPSYMSPEQARGEVDAMDERTDVWGLGAILFEILTGRPPYRGKNAWDVLTQVVANAPPKVRELAPDAPPELAAVADRALRRDPSERYGSAAELAEEIAAWQDGRRVGAYAYSSAELLRRFVARNKAASFAALAILVGALVSSGVVWRSYRDELAAREQAEARRTQAEAAEERARESARRAQAALAEAYLEKADRAMGEGDAAAAAIYAAAALVEDPANPASSHHDAGFAAGREARERVVRARSRLLAAERRRRHRFAGRLGDAARPLASRGAFSPDGARFAVAAFGEGWVVAELEGGAEPVFRPLPGTRAVWAWTGDGGVAIVAGERSGVYDAATGARRFALPATTRTVVRADEGLLLGTADGDLVLVAEEDGAERASLVTGLPSAERVAAGPRGLAAAAARGLARVEVWNLRSGERVLEASAPGAVQTLAFSPEGRTLAVGGQHPRVELHPLDGGPARSLETLGWVGGLSWRVGRLLASEGSARIVARDPVGGQVLESLHVPPGNGFRLAVGPAAEAGAWLAAVPARGPRAPDGVTLFAPVPGAAEPLDVGAAVRSFAVGGGEAERLAIVAADGVRVVDGGAVARWPLPEGARQPVAVDVAPTGAVAVATSDGAILVAEDGAFRVLAEPWAERAQPLLGLRFGPRGERLYASAGPGDVAIYELREGGQVLRFADHEGAVLGLAVAPDGRRFASAARDGVVCLRSEDAVEHALEGHGGLASDAAFSPDGARLATVDGVGTLRLWDATTGERLREIDAHRQWINRVVWDGAGRRLATASDDGTVRVWDAEEGALLRIFPTGTLAIGVAFRGGALLYHDRGRIHRVPLEDAREAQAPEDRLRAAEEAAGLQLDGMRLVPMPDGGAGLSRPDR